MKLIEKGIKESENPVTKGAMSDMTESLLFSQNVNIPLYQGLQDQYTNRIAICVHILKFKSTSREIEKCLFFYVITYLAFQDGIQIIWYYL